MEQTLQDFEKAWKRFETGFKGKLLEKSKKQTLSLSMANLVLKEASSDWFSGYGAEGKWLRDYKTACPDRAEAVTSILRHELKLGNEANQPPQAQRSQTNTPEARNAPVEPNPSDASGAMDMKSIVPAAGAIAGGVIASALSAPVIITLAAMAVPAYLAYTTMHKDQTRTTKTTKNGTGATGLNEYIAQLQVHKEKIIAVITRPD